MSKGRKDTLQVVRAHAEKSTLDCTQRRILKHLERTENRQKSDAMLAVDLNLSGGTKQVHDAFRDPNFCKVLASQVDFYPWMRMYERRLYESAKILKKTDGGRDFTTLEIRDHANLRSSAVTYLTQPRPEFRKRLEAIGFKKIPTSLLPRHSEVILLTSERSKHAYLNHQPVLDFRRLYPSFPENYSPNEFHVDLTSITDKVIRRELSRYIERRMPQLQPQSMTQHLRDVVRFLECLLSLFPECDIFAIDRHTHVVPIISAMSGSHAQQRTTLKAGERFLLDLERQRGYTTPTGLFHSSELPDPERTEPRPIDGTALQQLDSFLIKTVTPLLERGNQTPHVSPEVWDEIIVLRFTGLRHSDAVRLRDDSDPTKDCLRFDKDGDTRLVIYAEDTKTKIEHHVPLAFLNGTVREKNPVVEAINRQKKRCRRLPPCLHGDNYLFRASTDDAQFSTLPNTTQINAALRKICAEIGLTDISGNDYQFSVHQFRHTVACEMISNGVDIYGVAAFLGHKDIAKTQRYVKVMQRELKKQLQLAVDKPLYRTKWSGAAKDSTFDVDDGCCTHMWKIPSCPARNCKVCVRKKAFPRHLQGLRRNVTAYSAYAEHAHARGDDLATSRFQEVVHFSKAAIEAIEAKGEFDAKSDFFGKARPSSS